MSDEPTATAPTGDQDRITDSAAWVDPRDDAVLTEVAYRMQAEWPGGDVAQRAVLTAAMVARERADRLLTEGLRLGKYGEPSDWLRRVDLYLREGMTDV